MTFPDCRRAGPAAGLVAAIACAACLAAGAADTSRREPNVDPAAKLDPADSPALSAVERLALSDRLAAYGERNADPVALVQAAKIRKGLEPGKASAYTFEGLLDRAAQLAPGNPAIEALIADARAHRSRDLPLVGAGVSALSKLIPSRGTDRGDFTFRGAAPAVIYVRGPDDADLDLYVYDDYNNLICADESSSAAAQCSWRPRWTGSFLVDVRNKKDAEVPYVLTANFVEPGAAAAP
jgi:hypothetical protein